VLVSGGLDSAIVYALAKRHGDVVPYHVENDETAAAQRVVGERGARVFRHKDIMVEEALAYHQEPIDLGSLLPQVALSKVVEERVCLVGDGADEFFSGYGRAQRYDSQWSDVYHELVAFHLPRLDRVMMRNRVETRSPFLARRVAEIALALPWEVRRGKKILRDLFREDLPAGVADAPKRPLRTAEVERDREGWSKMLVDKFRSERWPDERR
jgi:asparagine synthetase B (glutamine-hydrolysing)